MNLMLLLDLVCIVVGLGVLWRAGDVVVHNIILIAQRFKISTFFIGFVVLAIAADIPELAIAISSALQGASEVAVGDIIGANFTDIALVVGLTLLLAGNKISIKKTDNRRLLLLLGVTAFIMILVFMLGSLNRIQGISLVLLYVAIVVWLWKTHNTADIVHQEYVHDLQHADAPLYLLIAKLVAGFVCVTVSSGLAVQYAVSFATRLHMPLELIGATILGVGTSLPELALSINALRRGDYALALGPTLGTVLGQTTLILGILATLSSKPVSMAGLGWAFWFMFAAFAVIGYCLINQQRMGRAAGAALISLFIAYLGFQATLGL